MAAITTTQHDTAGSGIEIDGQAVSSVLEGAGRLAPAYRDRALDILAGHDIPEPSADGWYDATSFHAVVTDISESVGPRTVSRIGTAMVDLVDWSADTDAVDAALTELDAVFQRLHRGGDVGSIDVEWTGDRTAIVTCETSYPDAFERGLLRGIAYRFSESVPRVVDPDDAGYEFSW